MKAVVLVLFVLCTVMVDARLFDFRAEIPFAGCAITGCTFTGPINMSGNAIYDAALVNPGLVEYDPIFTAENISIWQAINNRLNLSDQQYNDTTLVYVVNDSIWLELGVKLNTSDQRYNDTGYINNLLLNYYTKNQSDGLYYLLTNPAGYINESYANSTYYPLTNPAGYINTTDLSNISGVFVRIPGDNMTGDLNMTNHSIVGVDVLEVHNITGRSPIYVSSQIISVENITATNFFGNINGQNGTIFGMTITNGTITNMRVIDSAIFNTSLLPELNNTWNLGEGPDKYWRSFYVAELFAGNISSPDITNLYNITYWLEQNKLNITDQRYNDTYYADEVWIYRITTHTNTTDYYTFYFNNTLINITVQSIMQANYYNKTEVDSLISNISLTPGPPGINGTDGINGTGVNMSSIINNGDGTYTWYFSDGYNFTTGNLTGPQGISGINGTNGIDGLNGTNGINGTSVNITTVIDHYDGTFTWVFSDGTNFTTSNLTGPQGIPGINGTNGLNGTNGIDGLNGTNGINGTSVYFTNITDNLDGRYTWYFSDGYNFTTANLTGPQGIPGINGTNGIDGINGTNGINGTSVNMSSIINNGDGTYTWYFSDGYNFTTGNLTGPQGIPGLNGTNGIDGINGTNGINGTSVNITTVIDHYDGTFTWVFSDGTNFTTSNLTGPQGMQGIQGVNGTNGINGTSVNMSSIIDNGDGTYTWYFSDGYNFTTSNLTGLQGVQGIPGINGTDGVNGTSVNITTVIDNGDGTYTWVFSTGTNFTTSNLTGLQGIPGINGTNGIDGTNGTSVYFLNITDNLDGSYTWYFSDGYNYTTGNLTGPQGIQGIQGVNGTSFDVSGPYLYDNGSDVIYFNDTMLNITINNISKVRKIVYNMTCTASGGLCSIISGINISYQITEVKVIPTTGTNNYKFQLTEYPTITNIIDKDRAKHNGIWNIEKSYAINGQIQANITNANIDELFTISIIYLTNGVQ